MTSLSLLFTSLSNLTSQPPFPRTSLYCKMFPPHVSSEIKVYRPFHPSYSVSTPFLLFSTKRFLLLHCTLDYMVEETLRPPARRLHWRRLRWRRKKSTHTHTHKHAHTYEHTFPSINVLFLLPFYFLSSCILFWSFSAPSSWLPWSAHIPSHPCHPLLQLRVLIYNDVKVYINTLTSFLPCPWWKNLVHAY